MAVGHRDRTDVLSREASSGNTAAVHVRDSKVTEGPAFTVAPRAWTAFAAYAATA
ncbi:DUF397 domain-containing protein [Streptomyces sp. SJ1-7]|nr:DUF397 domain-containing protein [Streptomyces sp. SJ1-7]